MTNHHTFRPLRVALSVLTVLLLSLACTSREGPRELRHSLGFAMPFERPLTETTFLDSPKTGIVHYLSGDEVDRPRLTVHVEDAAGSIGQRLDELALVPEGMVGLDLTPLGDLHPINSEGQGLRMRVQPMPEHWPELVMLVDHRVYLHGGRFFCFSWQQPEGDADWLASWDRAAAGIVFFDDEAERP